MRRLVFGALTSSVAFAIGFMSGQMYNEPVVVEKEVVKYIPVYVYVEKPVKGLNNQPPAHSKLAQLIHRMNPNIDLHLATDIARYIIDATADKDIDPVWILAMAWQESKFNPRSVSKHGAVGLLQILPKTAQEEFNVPRNRLFDPKTNIEVGVEYLNQLRKQLGSLKMATVAYNQGIGNVKRGTYNTRYYEKVNSHYKKMISELSNNHLKLSNIK